MHSRVPTASTTPSTISSTDASTISSTVSSAISSAPSSDATSTPTPTAATTTFTPLVLSCLLATWLVWGSTYLAIRFALVDLPPFFQMGTRFLVAGAVLAAWMVARGAKWPTRRQWLHAAIVGGLMLGGGMGGTAYAEQTIASGLVVAFIAIAPFVQSLINMAWGERPSSREWLGIAVGLAGVMMLVSGSGFAASPMGLVAITLAVLLWQWGGALSRHTCPLAPGAMGFASQMLCGGALLMAMSWMSGEQPTWPPSTTAALAWLYLVVFGSLIAFNAYMVLLARTSGAVATSYAYVNPVIAMVLGVTLGQELVTTREWIAAGVIVAGVVLVLVGGARGSSPTRARH
jgi:drug/metabolite transporter (DMT)-like permease